MKEMTDKEAFEKWLLDNIQIIPPNTNIMALEYAFAAGALYQANKSVKIMEESIKEHERNQK